MKKTISSFKYACAGVVCFFCNERNGKIQLLAAATAVVLGFVYKIPLHEWMWVVCCIATVLSFEMINTALEKLCDIVEPAMHPSIKMIKDVAAAAVLVAALGSTTIGALIFLPKIFYWL